jgi:hypothetical protein
VNPLRALQGQKGADEQDVINIKQITKFVVGLGVAPTDIEEGMCVG